MINRYFIVGAIALAILFLSLGSGIPEEKNLIKTNSENLPVYSVGMKYLPYKVDENGTKVFELIANHFRWKILKNFSIEVYGFNNQIPGPAIRVFKGDRVRLIVHNNLTEPITVHFHGLNVPNEMDGVPFLTQEPIMPGKSFTYEFTVNQSGSFIYHTHFNVSKQLDMGLSGPLIVEDENSLNYSKEVIMFLDDFSVDEKGNNNAKNVAPADRKYNYFTINGKAFPDTEIIKVFTNDTVLFRFINIGNSNVPFHFHGLPVKIIREDSNYVGDKNLYRDAIDIAPGQRYDVEFRAINKGNWLIHSHDAKQIVNDGKYPGGIITVIVFLDGKRPSSNYGQILTTKIEPQKKEKIEKKVPLGDKSKLNPVREVYKDKWNPKDLMVVVEREKGALAFIDGSTHEIVGRVKNVGLRPHTMVFSSDGKYVYVIARNGWLTKIDLTSLEPVDFVKVGYSSRGTGISKEDRYVVVGNYDPKDVAIIDTKFMEIVKRYSTKSGENPEGSRICAVVETPQNYVIVALKDAGEVWVINMSDENFPIIKKFYIGKLLHDGFLTPDGKYFMLASPGGNFMWIMDVENLKEVGKIPVEGPHPGPGAVWKNYAFTASFKKPSLTVWDIKNWEKLGEIKVNGVGLDVRTYRDNRYPYVWWDSLFNEDKEVNKEIYVINASEIGKKNLSEIKVTVLKPEEAKGATMHPEFTRDGKYVYVSDWAENGRIFVFNSSYPFNIVKVIEGLTTPTGIFSVGNRIREYGI